MESLVIAHCSLFLYCNFTDFNSPLSQDVSNHTLQVTVKSLILSKVEIAESNDRHVLELPRIRQSSDG
ncbi:hypothetical protein MANES_13G064027v8 [Manihot esculenta]|uniref:Uncharacterized protein n=1 Tax=Manihot esculenta TaxID=3983 RepID=A0ACB7GJU2_MANES|nr:hypothetical protein MANES_13G064027v8 [Manihot esculenta]